MKDGVRETVRFCDGYHSSSALRSLRNPTFLGAAACSPPTYRTEHGVLKSILRATRTFAGFMNRKILELIRPIRSPALMAVADATRTKTELIAENAMLRQQLIIATRNPKKRWSVTILDRALLVTLASIARHFRDALLVTKPETLLRWHRQGFKLFWRWKTRRRAQSAANSASA